MESRIFRIQSIMLIYFRLHIIFITVIEIFTNI
jgi:hypothetical protein